MFTLPLFIIMTKRKKKKQCPTDGLNDVIIHVMYYYVTIKRNEVLLYATTWMNLRHYR